MIRTKVFEGHQNRSAVLRIALQVDLQLLDDIFKAIFGRNGTCLQHQMEFFSQKGGEIVEGAQNDLKLMHLEENVENSLVLRTNAPAVVYVSILP